MAQWGDIEDEPEDTEEEDVEGARDIALRPSSSADSPLDVERYISAEVRELYEVHSYRHAAAVLANSFPSELGEKEDALRQFRITTRDIGLPGGNETTIPKKFSKVLRPLGWMESRIQGDLTVRLRQYEERTHPTGKVTKVLRSESSPIVIENFIDGHSVDYVKGRVAFDLEWNSKDQTFDRDLYALRTFHECGLISAGILVTRSASLNPVFGVVQQLDKNGKPVFQTTGKGAGQPKSVKGKYGASTTWMGKLLYRLNAGRHGGCPILVFGISPKLIADWDQ